MMAIERTLSIIKPDATKRNLTGEINTVIEKSGLKIIAQKRVRWTRQQAEKFYAEHKGKPFYKGLVDFMTSGPIVVQVLEGDSAIGNLSRDHGRHGPRGGQEGYHPQALRAVQGTEFSSRLRQPGLGRARDQAQLQAGRDRRLRADDICAALKRARYAGPFVSLAWP